MHLKESKCCSLFAYVDTFKLSFDDFLPPLMNLCLVWRHREKNAESFLP